MFIADWKCVKNVGSDMLVLGGNSENRVILELIYVLGGSHGSYLEIFIKLSLFLAETYRYVTLVTNT